MARDFYKDKLKNQKKLTSDNTFCVKKGREINNNSSVNLLGALF